MGRHLRVIDGDRELFLLDIFTPTATIYYVGNVSGKIAIFFHWVCTESRPRLTPLTKSFICRIETRKC